MDFDEVEVDGNRLKLYGSGQKLFDDMLRAIDEAQHSILLETYIWKGDKLGQEFKRRLAAKADATGVAVKHTSPVRPLCQSGGSWRI